jgi:hypothetical protein
VVTGVASHHMNRSFRTSTTIAAAVQLQWREAMECTLGPQRPGRLPRIALTIDSKPLP